MHQLDETDLDILDLLIADARRPYSDIAERVDLSAPAVSDRIERLEELGVIQGFTVQVDRRTLEENVPVMLALKPTPAAVDDLWERLGELEAVEHRFRLHDGTIQAHAYAPSIDVHRWLRKQLTFDEIESYAINLVAEYGWTVAVGPNSFDLSCVVCGNGVGADGELTRIDGDIKPFCCPSCEQQYLTERQERLDAMS